MRCLRGPILQRLQLQQQQQQQPPTLTATITHHCYRSASTKTSSAASIAGSESNLIFNRKVKTLQRNAAALAPDYQQYQYLRTHIADNLLDRLNIIQRKFPHVVELGSNVGNIVRLLQQKPQTDLNGMQHLVQLDGSVENVKRVTEFLSDKSNIMHNDIKYLPAVCDEEWLPLTADSTDLVVSNLALHWLNDLPSVFAQVKQALKPDGVFLASAFGGATLQELRSAFAMADSERHGGVSPHISPFFAGRDLGDLLQTANFSMPTVDTEAITITYPDMFTLCEHLRAMGENGALVNAVPSVSRDSFLAAAACYQEMYANEDGTIPATFQVYYIIGWQQSGSQPKAKRRSANIGNFDDMQAALAEQQELIQQEASSTAAEQADEPQHRADQMFRMASLPKTTTPADVSGDKKT